MSYPADPPRVEEIVAVMCQAGSGIHGEGARGLIIVLWRAGLRIAEALGPARGRFSNQLAARCSCVRARAAARVGMATGLGATAAMA